MKDTNQASELFELCKEVYKRTGWETDELLSHRGLVRVPLYTSDYLLEKLEEASTEYNVQVYYSVVNKYWKALWVNYGSPSIANTPLKALLKLTIALSEAGELK